MLVNTDHLIKPTFNNDNKIFHQTQLILWIRGSLESVPFVWVESPLFSCLIMHDSSLGLVPNLDSLKLVSFNDLQPPPSILSFIGW